MTAGGAAALLAALLLAGRPAIAADEPPGWPEELGRTTVVDRDRAAAAIEEGIRRGTASSAARVRLGLLRLEPLPGRSVERARRELRAVADDPSAGDWGGRAKYALAWIEEGEADPARAIGAYLAVSIDDAGGEAARRAGGAAARLLLRDGRPADAAALAQAVVERGGAPGVEEIRETAIEEALLDLGAGPRPERLAVATGLREVEAMAAGAGGERWVADRKQGLVVRFDSGGTETERWSVAGVTAVAIDPFGRTVVAAGEAIFRLEGRDATPLGGARGFGPISALAGDRAGRIWIAGRRGDRVGRLDPEEAEARIVRSQRGAKAVSLAWDGRRVLLLESRSGRLVELAGDLTERTVAEGLSRSPDAVAADAAGRFAVLDAREGEVVVADSRGRVRRRLDLRAAGVERAEALALALDGSVHVVDGRDGRLVSLR